MRYNGCGMHHNWIRNDQFGERKPKSCRRSDHANDAGASFGRQMEREKDLPSLAEQFLGNHRTGESPTAIGPSEI